MKIYTGNSYGKSLDKVIELGLGIMISTSPNWKPSKEFGAVSCALDNGAFAAWKKGYPFSDKAFLDTLDNCYKANLTLDFIVCPDIVAGGERSLDFSMKWAMGKLLTAPHLALVVQDGMTPDIVVRYNLDHFDRLFVGGTVDWKWQTAEQWALFAHSKGKLCHIGQVGQLHYLQKAKSISADSVDSTSFKRNESWGIIRQYQGGNLFEAGIGKEGDDADT